MTQEEKQLLLQDLCARLPYGVICKIENVENEYKLTNINVKDLEASFFINEYKGHRNEYVCILIQIKPYLRSMSSMTEEEKEEIKPLFSKFTDEFGKRVLVVRQNKMALYQDFLNAHHFDYRDLIEKGLAIAVTKENNPYKE